MVEPFVKIDVREHIRSGREPFSFIMSTVARLQAGQKLLVIAPFEPVPLYSLLKQHGYSHCSTPRENGDWEVLFTPDSAEKP